jgi:hypothetical protein
MHQAETRLQRVSRDVSSLLEGKRSSELASASSLALSGGRRLKFGEKLGSFGKKAHE